MNHALIPVVLGVVIGCITYPSCGAVQEDPPRPPTCIEVRGPATDPAENDWSAACAAASITWAYHPRTVQMQCIESACIAFRGMP